MIQLKWYIIIIIIINIIIIIIILTLDSIIESQINQPPQNVPLDWAYSMPVYGYSYDCVTS